MEKSDISLTPPSTEPELVYVGFDGPDDPSHPQNWPIVQRRCLAFLLATTTMIIGGASGIFQAAIPAIMALHGISREVCTLGMSLYVLGFSFGPLIWASFSELKGRYFPLTISTFGFAVFSFATARSGPDLASIFICRFFAGLFGAGPLTVAGATLSDMFALKDRNLMLSYYVMTVFMGPMLAQPIGEFIAANPHLGWKWTEYLPGILGSACFLAMLFFLPETYEPVILARKADRLRRETGNWSIISKHDTISMDAYTVVNEYLILPLRMLFTEPIVFFMCLFGSYVYGLLYIFITAYPFVFEELHQMKTGISGLPFIGICLGMILFLIGTFLVERVWLIPRIIKHRGHMEPEWILPIAIPGSVFFSIGLFWFGWTGYKANILWIAPTASGIFTGFGLLACFAPSITYLVVSRPERSASAIAAHTFIRSLFAACTPLFGTYMFRNLGIQWASTLLGCLAALMIPIPVLLYVYGPKIRKRVKPSL